MRNQDQAKQSKSVTAPLTPPGWWNRNQSRSCPMIVIEETPR